MAATNQDLQLKQLLELRDEILALYKEAERAAEDDSEVTIGSNGINSFEALGVLNHLKKFADKCKTPVFVITGTLSEMTREEAHEKIRELGGEVSDPVSKNVTHLVVGEKPGSKLEKAKRLGIKVLDEKQFLAMLGSIPAKKSVKMSAEHKKEVLETVECEDFDYAMSEGYFENIKDIEFQKLLKEYLKAKDALAKYVGCEGV